MLGVAVSTVRSEGHAYGIEFLEEGVAEYTGNGRLRGSLTAHRSLAMSQYSHFGQNIMDISVTRSVRCR